MKTRVEAEHSTVSPELALPGGSGGMAERIRAFDWSKTPLGPLEHWPQSLRMAASLVLSSGFPMVLLWGPALTVCAYNEFYRPLLGRKPEALGRSFLQVWADARETLEPQLERARAGEALHFRDSEFLLMRDDHLERAWFDYSFSPVIDETGAVAGVLNTAIETTERHLAAASLREREAHHRTLAELSPDAILVNAGGKLVYANAAAARLLRADSIEQILGRSNLDVIAPEYRDLVRQRIGHVLAGSPVQPPVEQVWRRFDDSLVNVEVSAAAIEWGGQPAIQVLVRDITERKRAEAALRESEEHLRLAARAARFGTFDLDPRTGELYWSPEARDIAGAPQDEPLTLKRADELIHPEDRQRVVAEIRRSFDPAGPREFHFEHRFLHADGTIRWVLVRGRTFFDDALPGQPVRTVGVTLDITERKMLEESLREADRRKDEFLATLAHELRNPLAPIRNAVQILKTPNAREPQRQWSRDVIDRQVRQMARLLDDLLDISRITRGKIELRRERMSIRSAVEAAVEAARPLIDAKEHTLRLQLPDEPLWVDADPTRMTQIFGNLLTNAAKYTPAGGQILVIAGIERDEAVIRVRDNGIGMTEAQRSHLFEMFAQAQEALASAEGGLGVGLAITKGLVELHGGRIEAHSDGAGKGSEFIVRLPLG